MSNSKRGLTLIQGGGSSSQTQKDSSNAMIIFTPEDITYEFKNYVLHYATDLFMSGRVLQHQVTAFDNKTSVQIIKGSVLDRGEKNVQVKVVFDPIENEIDLVCSCTCRGAKSCTHAAALLLQALEQCAYRKPMYASLSAYELLKRQSKSQDTSVEPLNKWAEKMSQFSTTKPERSLVEEESIVYLLSTSLDGFRLKVTMESARKLKKGGYGKSKSLSMDPYYAAKAEKLIRQDDKDVLNNLYALQEDLTLKRSEFDFELKDCNALLESLLHTGRVYWENTAKEPLSLGERNVLAIEWEINQSGEQHLIFQLPDRADQQSIHLLPTNPVWYCDTQTKTLGVIDSELPANALIGLKSMPSVKATDVNQVQDDLKKIFPNMAGLPQLKEIIIPKKKEQIKPVVELRLYGHDAGTVSANFWDETDYYEEDNWEEGTDGILALAECRFHYKQHTVTLADPEEVIEHYENQQLHLIERDIKFEKKCIDILSSSGLDPVTMRMELKPENAMLAFSFLIADSDDEEESMIAEKLSNLQSLATSSGWQINLEATFPARIVHETDQWYTNLEENSSGIDWFGVSIGVMLNGKTVNILPLLLEQIQTQFKSMSPADIKALPDTHSCELRMDNGEYLKVPFPRIKNILLILCELFEERPLDENGLLKLSRAKAGLLQEISKAVGATNLRWLGSSKLKAFSKRLANFKEVKTVEPAKIFKATLREYQQDGLNWLQFLREFELNGILADDMGLGKTVQTLAHLCVEKEKKRLKKPSLLIAPTSLMTNWVNEAEKFAPSLSVLVLHGAKRHDLFDQINRYDIVLTTYPLVVRDKKKLLAHEFKYLILDEAQQIKNAQAKMTQIILQLKAKHRLCLTGTPMENHLGELWSLFNFLLPGLLGTSVQFKRLFRTPIEKNNDKGRHKQLVQRIKPFLLRRKKGEVVQDLPDKTEIVRSIELADSQRDLYESVRLAMEDKIRKAIDAQGMNRSQIIILDALLKLRQICCAPPLLKLSQAKSVKESAKLDDLMEFLPNLLEEGRRVLIFSSFTSMLSLIEERLKQNKIAYAKLIGSTVDRKIPINQFQNKEVALFLISLKAGGVGLNLTAADTVIHYDPWWNPAAEQQATGRAHRIGQKNPVFVYKMIAKGTVEERILEMQEKKSAIIDSVLDSGAETKLKLTQGDLNQLFKPLAD